MPLQLYLSSGAGGDPHGRAGGDAETRERRRSRCDRERQRPGEGDPTARTEVQRLTAIAMVVGWRGRRWWRRASAPQMPDSDRFERGCRCAPSFRSAPIVRDSRREPYRADSHKSAVGVSENVEKIMQSSEFRVYFSQDKKWPLAHEKRSDLMMRSLPSAGNRMAPAPCCREGQVQGWIH